MSKISIDKKYKDRDPQETIDILTNFFNKDGYHFKINTMSQTEAGSWWCSIALFFGDQQVGFSNGKGTTEKYCLASGLAELYERQCNGVSGILDIYPINKYVKEQNFKNYGYYLDPNEKELTIQEALTNSFRIADKYELLSDHKGNLEKYLSLIHDNKFIGIPYTGINVKDTKYLVPELVFSVTGSDGMAAGNTIEEALVQGISEVFEHRCWDEIFNTYNNYYFLDLDTLTVAPYVRTMLNNIKEKGYTVYVIDFSYNLKIPVLATYIVNNENHTMFLNLGAHPVFDIAFERLITEIYQGYNVLIDSRKLMMKASRNIDLNEMRFMHATNLTGVICYPEECFYKRINVNDYNHDIFLSGENQYSNEELLEYYINLSNKLGWNFYYRDWSMIKEVKAIQVYVDNQIIFNMSNIKIESLTDNQKTILLKANIQQLKLILKYYETKEIDKNYSNIFNNLNELFSIGENIIYSNSFMIFDFAQLYSRNIQRCCDLYEGLSSTDKYSQLLTALHTRNLAPYIQKALHQYKLLFTYKDSKKYTDDEIKQICDIYNMNYTEQDYEDANHVSFFVKKIIFEGFYNEVYGEYYQKYLQMIYQRRHLIDG